MERPEIRRTPWTDDIYEKARLAFEMNHEMSYHEMCGVIERLRNENEALRGLLHGLDDQIRKHTTELVDMSARYMAVVDDWDESTEGTPNG